MGTYYSTGEVSWRARFAESLPILRQYAEEKQAYYARIVTLSDQELLIEAETNEQVKEYLSWTTVEKIREYAGNYLAEWKPLAEIEDDEEFVKRLFEKDRWTIDTIEDGWITNPYYVDEFKYPHETEYMNLIAEFVESGSFIECKTDYDDVVTRLYWVGGKPAQVVYPTWIIPE